MSEADFDALVRLIERMIDLRFKAREHPNDRPRYTTLQRDYDDAVEEARQVMVL